VRGREGEEGRERERERERGREGEEGRGREGERERERERGSDLWRQGLCQQIPDPPPLIQPASPPTGRCLWSCWCCWCRALWFRFPLILWCRCCCCPPGSRSVWLLRHHLARLLALHKVLPLGGERLRGSTHLCFFVCVCVCVCVCQKPERWRRRRRMRRRERSKMNRTRRRKGWRE
jgi:hypothetical protein